MSMNTIPMQAIHNMQQQQLLSSITMMDASNDNQCNKPMENRGGLGLDITLGILFAFMVFGAVINYRKDKDWLVFLPVVVALILFIVLFIYG